MNAGISMSVKIDHQGKRFNARKLSQQIEIAKTSLQGVANIMVDDMRNIIETSKRSGSGELAKSLDATVTREGDTFVIGIGDKRKMPKYWYVMNYGKYYNTGIDFIPGRPANDPFTPRFVHGYWSGDQFVYDKSSDTGVIAMNPVKGIHFIEQSTAKFAILWKELVMEIKNLMRNSTESAVIPRGSTVKLIP